MAANRSKFILNEKTLRFVELNVPPLSLGENRTVFAKVENFIEQSIIVETGYFREEGGVELIGQIARQSVPGYQEIVVPSVADLADSSESLNEIERVFIRCCISRVDQNEITKQNVRVTGFSYEIAVRHTIAMNFGYGAWSAPAPGVPIRTGVPEVKTGG